MRTFFNLLYILAAAGSIFIGLQVYLKDRNNRVNRLFALLCLSVACWAFIAIEFYYSPDLEMAEFWLNFVALWPLPSSILLHFVLVYTGFERYLKKGTLALLVYLPAIALIAIVQLLGGYSINQSSMYEGWAYSDPGALATVLEFLVVFSLNATGLALCLLYYRRQHEAIKRKQSGFILIGLSFPLLAGILEHGLLLALDISVPELSILGFVIGTGSFSGYAVWKYQLFAVTPGTTAEKTSATMTCEMMPVSLSKASMKDADDNPAGAALIPHDISERRNAEQTLQKRDMEFKTLVEHTSDMVIRFDRERRITYMNSACKKALNITNDEFLGMTCEQSGLPAGLVNAWDEAVGQVIETGAERKLEHELRTSESVFIYDTRLTPELSENGSIESVLMVSRDISEHVNTEQALAETESLYHHIFDQSTDVLVHLDRNARIVDVNGRALEISGLKKDDLVGKKISALAGVFTKSSIGRMVKSFTKRVVGVAVPPYEVEVHSADGRLMFFEVSAAPLTGSDGSRIGEIAMLHDVTERKMDEEKVRLQKGALAKRSEELAGLFQISTTISKTLEIDLLLDQALEEITSMRIMDIRPEGGIFILEGDRLRLAASKNVGDGFMEAHRHLKVGQCLCGTAAREGEILVSRNSTYDSRHTISYPGMKDHGDIIVPLTASDGICGVMFLHTEPNIYVRNRDLDLLRTIGSQLGLAIKNALLFEETKALSLHDPLTGVANRNLMNIELKKLQALSRRNYEPLSLIMADLDHFKRFNDTYGHAAGDIILAAVAGILKNETREIDLVVRYGGEEFLLLLPNTPRDLAKNAAERIRHKVETTSFPVTDGHREASLTISQGIATSLDGSESPEILITRADTAMYMAKGRGRNRVEEWIS